MSFAQAQRGAVHIAFLVIAVLVMLVFGALWFTKGQDFDKSSKELVATTKERDEYKRKFTWAQGAYRVVAQTVGSGLSPDLPIPSNVADTNFSQLAVDDPAIGKKTEQIMAEAKAVLAAAGDPARAKDLRAAIDLMKSSYDKVVSEVTARDSRIKNLEGDIETQKKAVADANKKRDDDVAALQTEKENATNRLSQQVSETTTERDAAQNKNTELNNEVSKLNAEKTKDVNAARLEMKQLDASVSAIKSQQRTARDVETPDGKVLAVNRTARTLWIDLGSRDLLRRGTRFKVYQTTKGGEKTLKGVVVVTSLETDRSEAKIESEVAGAGGVAEGDWITNPFFDKGKTKHFVFLGALNGRLPKETAVKILESYGAKVDENVGVDTDFVVLGAKTAPDAEDPAESAAYKKALNWGIEVIRARDLDTYLQN